MFLNGWLYLHKVCGHLSVVDQYLLFIHSVVKSPCRNDRRSWARHRVSFGPPNGRKERVKSRVFQMWWLHPRTSELYESNCFSFLVEACAVTTFLWIPLRWSRRQHVISFMRWMCHPDEVHQKKYNVNNDCSRPQLRQWALFQVAMNCKYVHKKHAFEETRICA